MRFALRGRGTRRDDLRAARLEERRGPGHDGLPAHLALRTEPRPLA
jgi:hypothetical protein